MRYMLDTHICIYLINKRPPKVLDHFRRLDVGDVGISSVTVAELAYGVAKSGSERSRAALEGFLLPLEIADFDQKAAWKFGEIRSDFCPKSKDRQIPPSGKLRIPRDSAIVLVTFAREGIVITSNICA